jgi:hypothetical protein
MKETPENLYFISKKMNFSAMKSSPKQYNLRNKINQLNLKELSSNGPKEKTPPSKPCPKSKKTKKRGHKEPSTKQSLMKVSSTFSTVLISKKKP